MHIKQIHLVYKYSSFWGLQIFTASLSGGDETQYLFLKSDDDSSQYHAGKYLYRPVIVGENPQKANIFDFLMDTSTKCAILRFDLTLKPVEMS